MARRKIEAEAGLRAVQAVVDAIDEQHGAEGEDRGLAARVERSTIALAVRFLLEELETIAPGRSVEVRVPPFGAVQCLQGPQHTRGTPSNVVEMSADSWLRLALGDVAWLQAVSQGLIRASGERADLSSVVPLMRSTNAT